MATTPADKDPNFSLRIEAGGDPRLEALWSMLLAAHSGRREIEVAGLKVRVGRLEAKFYQEARFELEPVGGWPLRCPNCNAGWSDETLGGLWAPRDAEWVCTCGWVLLGPEDGEDVGRSEIIKTAAEALIETIYPAEHKEGRSQCEDDQDAEILLESLESVAQQWLEGLDAAHLGALAKEMGLDVCLRAGCWWGPLDTEEKLRWWR